MSETLIAGKDFPSRFERDLFTERRSGTCYTSGNPYDPEGLLTGEEDNAGMDYDNSRRGWASEEDYNRAVGGHITPEEIAQVAPRVLIGQRADTMVYDICECGRYIEECATFDGEEKHKNR